MRLPLPTPRRLLIAAALTLAGITAATAASGDVHGAKDYPGIGRFKGSVITGYVVKNFDATRLEAGPFKHGKPTDQRHLEGHITRIAYRTGAGPSILEVSRNFENQLKSAGFDTLLKCDTKECGGLDFARALDRLPIPQMSVDGFNFRYYAGHKKKNGQDIYATVVTSKNNGHIYTQLTVAVVGAMKNKMVDAAAMAKGLGEKGHIALYGIYFDTDKAVIKPASKPTLEQIAKLLQSKPKLSFYIVGHTDNQGTYAYNMTLSRKRAAAVAAVLIKSYHIARGRLQTAGVGFLAPVASNATAAGRALNRRVELVEP